MRHNYLKSDRILKRSDFKKISREGATLFGRFLVFSYLPKEGKNPRLGVTVTKKFGKAHERNRFKRIAREAFRRLKTDISDNLSLNLRPRGHARHAKMQDIMDELLTLSKQCHDKRPKGQSITNRGNPPQ